MGGNTGKRERTRDGCQGECRYVEGIRVIMHEYFSQKKCLDDCEEKNKYIDAHSYFFQVTILLSREKNKPKRQ